MAPGNITTKALEEALAIAGVGCWAWDTTSRTFRLSENFHQLLGCSVDGLPGTPEAWLASTHPDERHLLGDLFEKLTANEGCDQLKFTLRLRHASGMWLWFEVRTRRQSHATRPNGSMLITFSDITEQKQAEAALRDSQLRYRALYTTSPLAFVQWDRQGHISEWNRRAETLFGWQTSEAIGHPVHRLLLPEDQHDAFRAAIRALTQGAGDGSFSGPALNRDGQLRQCNWHNVALRAPNGKLIGILSLILDASNEWLAHQQLESHRQNLEQLVTERTIELEATRSTLSMIIDGSPVPTLVLDANHNVTHWNRACESMVGISAAEIVGTRQQWKAFYPSERPIMADLVMQNNISQIDAIYGGKHRHSSVVAGGFECESFFPDLKRWLFFTAAPLLDKDGNVIGAVETLQDVSERKQAEEAMLVAKAVAEAAADTKADFLANMNHEIRTPMNAVIGLAHLLLKTELSGKQRDYVTRIQGAGKMLLGLINDILDFSKIDAGQMTLEANDFHLDELLGNVTTIVQTRAQEKGLELHYVVDPDVPARLIGDPLRLAQILVNLIGNAIKFTARGAVSVFIRRQPLQDNEILLEVAVQDSGIGMTAEQQGKLFQAFSQGDTSITRKYGGTGLGLTICKRLSQLMQGDISVSSVPGQGSTFTFTVQLGVGATGQEVQRPALRRVLVVDDNPLARTVIARLLEKAGCQTVAVESGEQALETIAEHKLTPFDCITIDLNMPGMDGIELAEAIGGLAIKPPPRLVMVTSTDTNEIEDTGRLAGFEAVLHKPVTAAQISQLVATTKFETAPSEAQPPAQLAGVSILLVEDIPTNQLIATEILESFGATVQTADNGRFALEKLLDQGRLFDIVLMDLQMPEIDGLEATRRIRASGRHANLPIIAMTAHALEDEKRRCTEAGMNDFLSKPIDPVLLQQVLLRWKPGVAMPEKIPPRGPSTATDANGLPALPGIDTLEGLQRMMNKPRLYERILRDFHGRFVNEAVMIRQALAEGDRDSAQRGAHSTKGLAGSIGAHDLQTASLALEQAIEANTPDLESCLNHYAVALATVTSGIASGFNLT